MTIDKGISEDEKLMQKALKLAERGIGSVEPNPAVGCIITKGNQIVGKGWHKKFGGPHAEINALEDCKSLGVDPAGSTMYVTLEPCCHEGKTGPCTEVIIAAKAKKVYVATVDPYREVDGKGIDQLRDAGIEVESGVCQKEAELLNAPYIKYARTGKCWVILKWAQSIDGMVAWADKDKRWISGEASRKDIHKLRQRAQGILVGIETVLADNPLLTARPGKGKKLTRIVLDSQLRVPLDSQLLNTPKNGPVIIATSNQTIQNNPSLVEQISQKDVQLLMVPERYGKLDLHYLLDELGRRKVAQLLVEGGPRVICSFLRGKLADEICVYISSEILGSRGSVNISKSIAELSENLSLNHVDIKRFDDDVRISGLSRKIN